MNGADLKKLKEELGLNDLAMARIGGLLSARVLMEAYANQEKLLGRLSMFPPLAHDIFHEMWRITSEMSPEEKKAYGLQLAKEMHTHGTGYVVWFIMDGRCSGWKESENEPTEAHKLL